MVNVCAVCDKEATQRCSGCSGRGFDLFVCSKEHLKLIWPIHSTQCRSKSAAFVAPPLEETAFHLIKAQLNETLSDCPSISAYTSAMGLGEADEKTVIELYSSTCAIPEPRRTCLLIALRLNALHLMLSQAFEDAIPFEWDRSKYKLVKAPPPDWYLSEHAVPFFTPPASADEEKYLSSHSSSSPSDLLLLLRPYLQQLLLMHHLGNKDEDIVARYELVKLAIKRAEGELEKLPLAEGFREDRRALVKLFEERVEKVWGAEERRKERVAKKAAKDAEEKAKKADSAADLPGEKQNEAAQ
ncbi:hypothetical protein JCM8097_001055 [Rhodosporidiobolus ruineniae]